MTARWRVLLAWVGAVLGPLLGLAALALLLSEQAIASQPLPDRISSATYILAGVVMALVGAFLALRKADNGVSWITLGAGLSLTVAAFAERYANRAGLPPDVMLPGGMLALWLIQWMWLLPYGGLLLLLLFYPTGRLLSPRWRWVLGLIVLAYAALAVWLGFGETLDAGVEGGVKIPNPVGFLPAFHESSSAFLLIALFASLVVALTALGLRFHRARGVERAQMKWLVFAGAIFILVAFPAELLSVRWGGLLVNGVSLGIPLAIAIAILRYRLFDIDVIIRRTTSYAVITGLLALVYFGSVVAFQSLFGQLIDDESTVAVVLSTLLIAALFLPVRRRVQDDIDRRYNRMRYDAEKTLERFAAAARDETDLDALTAELLRVIQETMQPEHVTIWLRDAGSTGGINRGLSAWEE